MKHNVIVKNCKITLHTEQLNHEISFCGFGTLSVHCCLSACGK